jgi:hypothetical protein
MNHYHYEAATLEATKIPTNILTLAESVLAAAAGDARNEAATKLLEACAEGDRDSSKATQKAAQDAYAALYKRGIEMYPTIHPTLRTSFFSGANSLTDGELGQEMGDTVFPECDFRSGLGAATVRQADGRCLHLKILKSYLDALPAGSELKNWSDTVEGIVQKYEAEPATSLLGSSPVNFKKKVDVAKVERQKDIEKLKDFHEFYNKVVARLVAENIAALAYEHKADDPDLSSFSSALKGVVTENLRDKLLFAPGKIFVAMSADQAAVVELKSDGGFAYTSGTTDKMLGAAFSEVAKKLDVAKLDLAELKQPAASMWSSMSRN